MVTDGIVKIHVQLHLRPHGLKPNPQVSTCLQSLQQLALGLRCPCTCYGLDSTRPTGQLAGRGVEVAWRVSIGRLLAVDTACTCWTLIACQLHDGSLCCCLFTVCSTSLCLGPEACTRRKCSDAAAVCDCGASLS